VIKDVRILGYFQKPNGVHELKILRNTDIDEKRKEALENYYKFSIIS